MILEVTYDEKDNVDGDRECPVEERDKDSKDGGKEQKTHGVAILLGRVVESLSTSVPVNLLGSQAEQTSRDTEDHKENDGLLVSQPILLYVTFEYLHIQAFVQT